MSDKHHIEYYKNYHELVSKSTHDPAEKFNKCQSSIELIYNYHIETNKTI